MCKPRQLADLLRAAEQDIRRRQARALDIVAAIHRNRVGKALGHDNTMRLLQDNLLLSPTEAGRRLKRALNLCTSQALTGETLAPKLGLVSDAMRRGTRGFPNRHDPGDREQAPRQGEHRRTNAKTPKLPWWNTRRATPPAASSNSANASTTTSTPTAQHRPNRKTKKKPRRELSLHTGRDGRLNFRGSFDGETGTLLTEILSPLGQTPPHPRRPPR